MKYPIIILYLLLPSFLFSQDPALRKKTDSVVKLINAHLAKAFSFSNSLSTKTGKKYKVHYRYYESGRKIVKIIRIFTTGNAITEQTFYVNGNKLLFSTEQEVLYFGKDSSIWAGTYYFSKGKLADYETLGHGKSESDVGDWNPEKEVLANYNRAVIDINSQKRKRTGG